MNKSSKNECVKRTLKDYPMSFKLQIVQEIEQSGWNKSHYEEVW
nr:hypothetical protein [Ancylomarina sp. DW003]